MPSSAFLRYCKTLSRAGSPVSSQARACLRVGGRDPSTCRNKLGRELSRGTIDSGSHEYRLDAVNVMAGLYADRDRLYDTMVSEDEGWDTLGEGSRVRRAVVYDSGLFT